MVIQRQWRPLLPPNWNNARAIDFPQLNINIQVDDSNSSWSPVSNRHRAETILETLQQRFTQTSLHPPTPKDAAHKSLELLRASIQMVFDKEIEIIMKKFIQLFLAPAVKNIKDNLGENIVTHELLRAFCCSLLDNAKTQLSSYIAASSTVVSATNTLTPATPKVSQVMTVDTSDSESSSENYEASGAGVSLLQQALKRKRPDCTYSEIYKKMCMPSSAPILSLSSGPSSFYPYSMPALMPAPARSTRSIHKESLFILDFKAGRALGLTDLRERLANKHPEVLRYPVDNQDREWLLQQKLIPPFYRNAKNHLLLLTEVQKLTELAEYKNNLYGLSTDLQGFKVPEIIYFKILRYDKEVSERGNGAATERAVDYPTKPRSLLSSSHATLSALLASSTTAASESSENYSI